MYNVVDGNSLPEITVPITVIAENLSSLGLKPTKKKFNTKDYLPITYIKARDLKVANKIQRLVIISMIKGAKSFNGKLARPLYVFKRPNGDLVITDGQHTAIIAILYTSEGRDLVLPCQVDEHPSHFTIKECEKAEAQKFRELNSKRRQAGKVDKLRADIAEGLDEGLKILTNLEDMGVHVEKLGNTDGPEVKGFTMLISALKKYELKNVRSSIKLYLKLQNEVGFPKWNDVDKPLNGGLIGGLSAVYFLIEDHLGVGDKRFALENFLEDNLGKIQPKTVLDNTAGVSQPVLIARKIIDSCNALIDQDFITKKNGECFVNGIGEEVMLKAGLGDPSKMVHEK